MPESIHPAQLDPATLLAQCQQRRTRRSGPGGQNRNKVETAIILTHGPTGIIAEANERRSQSANLDVALHRLRVRLALEVRSQGVPGAPSALWLSRSRGGRVAVNPEHEDFPALLAEALDHLAACRDEVAKAAEALGCTPTQLVKLLKHEPTALTALNGRRAAIGLAPLR